MTVFDFGQKSCEKTRRYLDSYLSNELLVETNHEVLRHMETCPSCTEELDQKMRALSLLRGAVARQMPPEGLEDRVRKTIRARAAAGPVASQWQRWSIAALLLMGLAVGGTQGLRLRRDYGRQTALLEVGLNDHVHCALGARHPDTPPTFAEMTVKMGSDFAQLVPIVARKAAGYRVIEGHQCTAKGRNYEHIILKGDAGLMSVVVTRKRAGETFPRSVLLPVLRESGIDLHEGEFQRLEVSGFETRDYLVFVVSNLDKKKNLQMASLLAPEMRDALKKMEG